MNVSIRCVSLAAVACLALGVAAEAQQLRRLARPVGEARLELADGTVTRQRIGRAKGAPGFNTAFSFRKTTLSGFVGNDTGGGTCRWIQQFAKQRDKSSFVTSFRFAYCSVELDVNSGGPGGRTRIGFREGYTVGTVNGGGATGTELAFFNLSGLPANTKKNGFFGGAFCIFITIELGSDAFVLPDSALAYSWDFQDVGTDGIFAATFPFFACVASCSGPLAFPAGTMTDGGGSDDRLDSYCPASGGVSSTFSFGTSTSGFNFTALNMEIREAAQIVSTQTILNPTVGAVTNPLILSTGTGPVMAGLFTFTLDCSGAAPGKLAIGRVSFVPPAPPAATKFGILLVSLAGGAATGINFFVPHGGGVVPFSLPIAFDIAAYGACFPMQMFCGDSPFGYLSNATINTIGSL